MVNILDRIVETKRAEVAQLPSRDVTPESMAELSASLPARRDFVNALAHPRSGDIGIIAEVKKASPSKGVIKPDFNHLEIARAYDAGKAGCLSVLTDGPWFQGHLDYLREIRECVSLPLLRKDFMIDPKQFPEALCAGADAILLIVSILTDQQLRDFRLLAEAAGMAALVEVHDLEELDRALQSGASLIGVNNRDLKSFSVDLNTTVRVAEKIQPQAASGEIFLVAESGIHTRDDVEILRGAGARALLVGESLMKSDDPVTSIHHLTHPVG